MALTTFAIVPRLLGPEEKSTRIEWRFMPGSNGEQPHAGWRLGISAGWLGLIGDDESGRLITKAFADDGLDPSGIETISG